MFGDCNDEFISEKLPKKPVEYRDIFARKRWVSSYMSMVFI